MKLVQDQVILVTFGKFNESLFMLKSDFHSWLQTIDKSERGCVLVTETNFDASDLDLMQRTNKIVSRLEREIVEQRETLVRHMKHKKRA